MEARRTTYCAGLPLDRERPLTAEERDRVTGMRRAHRSPILSRLLLALVALLPAAFAAHAAEGATGPLALLAAAALVLFGLVIPLAALFWLRSAVLAWLALGRDLRGGAALRFASGDRSVTVLPHSGFVIEWDGIPTAFPRRLVVGEAASVPESVATYAVDARIAGAAPGLDVVRRPLTPAERDEIASHAERLGRVPPVLAVFSAAFAFLAWQVLGDRGGVLPGSAPLVLLWAVLLGYSWWRFLKARRLARKLSEDGSNGWALRATAGDPAGSEVLAVSGVAWTVQGAPAAWRTMRGRRRGA
jgi:hypothetical protein